MKNVARVACAAIAAAFVGVVAACSESAPSAAGQETSQDAAAESEAADAAAESAAGDSGAEAESDASKDSPVAEAEASTDECIYEPGDVVGLHEERYPTPAIDSPDYQAMAQACPVMVLDRVMPTDDVGFNHTIIITEGGTWSEAKFVHATDPGGVFEARLKDWIETKQTGCGWQFIEGEVYRAPSSYIVSGKQAAANARSYIGEKYAITPDRLKPETWAHFRDDPNAKLQDVIQYESLETALGMMGEFAWDFSAFGVSQFTYSQPRYCGMTKAGTESCGIRQCNVWPEPGKGTKYCSELAWWAYAGNEGKNAAGTRPAGKSGEVPDLYEHQTSVMKSMSHTSNDLVLNFEVKCKKAPFKELKKATN